MAKKGRKRKGKKSKSRMAEMKIKNEIVRHGKLEIMIMRQVPKKRLNRLRKCHGVLIEYMDELAVRRTLDTIRHHRDMRVALIPIFLSNGVDSETISSLVDGVLSFGRFTLQDQKRMQEIGRRVRRLDLGWSVFTDIGTANTYRNLLYFVTRGRMLTSLMKSPTQHDGYFMPMIDKLMPFHERIIQVEAFDNLVRNEIVRPEFKDQVYICPECQHAHLLIRESCPKCKSLRIQSQELVHHFSCAHVAPIGNFLRNEVLDRRLECPKCNKNLKHIGVDYDKPSEIFVCGDCQSQFQQSYMLARCCHCDSESGVDLLQKRTIMQYRLLVSAEEFCRFLSQTHRPNTGSVQGLGMANGHEASTAHRPTITSTGASNGNQIEERIYSLTIENLGEVVNILGKKRTDEMILEITEVIRASITSDDFVEWHAPSFTFSQRHRTSEMADQIMRYTSHLVKNLVHANQNFSIEFIPSVRVAATAAISQ